MSDILCSWTDLEAQHCDGEEFQPQHRGVLSEKVIGCCVGLDTPCQCMWGSVEMAGIRCALTYQAAQHCRNQRGEVLVHAGNTIAARARLRRRSCGGGGGVVGEEGRADSTAEKGFAEVLAKNPNRNTWTFCQRKCLICFFTRRSETLRLWQRRILIESAQRCIQI